MALDSTLRAGRRRAVARMKDRCTIERPTGEQNTSNEGVVTAVFETLATNYPFRLRSFEPYENLEEVGGERVTVERSAARFPVSEAYVPQPGDRITVTKAAADQSLVGSIYTVANAPQTSNPTQYRVAVTEVTS